METRGRKPIPITDGKKLCRGVHGCGRLLPVDKFGKQQDIYLISHCRECERKRQSKIRKQRAA